MKEQEYVDKYFEKVDDIEEISKNAVILYQDLIKEYSEILAKRNVKTLEGAVGIVRELNEKWNSVVSKVEKKHKEQIIRRNVIWNTLLSDQWGKEYPRKPD